MILKLFLTSLIVLASGAAASLPFASRRWPWAGRSAAVAGSALAAAAGWAALMGGPTADLMLPWRVPMGSFHVGLDALSAFFVTTIALVSAAAAVFGGGYLRGDRSGRAGGSWLYFNLLAGSMLLLAASRNGVLFLVSWEVMSLSSFFLVMFDRERESVVRAGWTYLVATHLGTALLLAMFVILGRGGTLEFERLASSGQAAIFVFVLAVLGFGTKAGLVPLHVWLPEAHPAAPSHVSAVMSGVMIKTGIYGILRVLTFLGDPQPWWGWTLLVAGAASGVLGVLFALAQHDIKRLLAYHSVENIGIITLGLGIGLLGMAAGNTTVAVLGLAGGLLHVLNHAVFKSLLFMGAGSVVHATGTRQIDQTGGLLRRMPTTGASFLVGSAAISAMPPLNGFVSEFLIYSAGFAAVLGGGRLLWAGSLAIGSLALIGGLAAACFAKAFGIIFLGEPRSESAGAARESNLAMRLPLLAMAAACLLLGLGAGWVFALVGPAVAIILGGGQTAVLPSAVRLALMTVSAMGLTLLALVFAIASLRGLALRGRNIRQAPTWDCGYLAPTARMQYTASSFAHPIVNMFRLVLRPRVETTSLEGLLPSFAPTLHTSSEDVFYTRLYAPLFQAVRWAAGQLRVLHQGQTHLYVLYIALTILLLLLWRLV